MVLDSSATGYRLQDVANKPAEDANMVETEEQTLNEEECQVHINAGNHVENVFFNEVSPGYAIMDSGATKSVIGEEVMALASWASGHRDLGKEGDQRLPIRRWVGGPIKNQVWRLPSRRRFTTVTWPCPLL